ncbi:MAG: hypothetical protein NVS2B16_31080 [Chloroflexota bacterium]
MTGKVATCLLAPLALTVVAWTVWVDQPTTHRSLPAPGHGWVAYLPDGQGLQYCMNLAPEALAPVGSISLNVYSLSAAVTTNRAESASMALQGRYPGWDNGATIYEQPFTSFNAVDVEIDDLKFHPGMDCMEIYGPHVRPAQYRTWAGHVIVGYSYRYRGHPFMLANPFPFSWGRYLPQYSPRHRPKH